MSRFCTSCGHQLGIGRYCTNCGARIPETSDAGSSAPSSARYPLFADTVQSPAASPLPTQAPPAQAPPSSYDDDPSPLQPSKPRRRLMPWLIALLVVATFAAMGGALLLLAPSGDDGDDGAGGRTDRPRDAAGQADDNEAPADPGSELAPVDVEVPGTAPPSVDGDGNRVTFTAANMLDADPTTSWRMAGDGTGAVLTFAFDDAVTVTEVGLINGYAKIDPPNDWYTGNRRITEVVWVFDDGTEVAQQLDEDQALQTTRVDAVETTTVELRLVQVTAPGNGPDARDYTAISDVKIFGPS